MSLVKQTSEPLFPDVLWNQPVSKKAAGRLLIIGGHSQQFSRVQEAYIAAKAAGAGNIKVVLPKALRKTTGALPDCVFVPSNPAGSIAKEAEPEIHNFMSESDAVLLPGEMSQNTETISMLETLIGDGSAPIILADELVRSLLHTTEGIKNTSVITATPQTLSEFAHKLHIPVYVKTPDLQKEQRLLNALAEEFSGAIVCHSQDHVLVSSQGEMSLTSVSEINGVQLAAWLAVFYMQHTQKFEALTTAVYQLSDNSQATKP